MHCTCVRHTELPNTSALFADVLYHPDRTAGFYRHPYRELSSFQDAAREIDLSAGGDVVHVRPQRRFLTTTQREVLDEEVDHILVDAQM